MDGLGASPKGPQVRVQVFIVRFLHDDDGGLVPKGRREVDDGVTYLRHRELRRREIHLLKHAASGRKMSPIFRVFFLILQTEAICMRVLLRVEKCVFGLTWRCTMPTMPFQAVLFSSGAPQLPSTDSCSVNLLSVFIQWVAGPLIFHSVCS